MSTCKTPILPTSDNVDLTESVIESMRIMNDVQLSSVQRTNAQNIVEKYLVDQGSCHSLNPEIFDDFRYRLFTFDDNKLENILNTAEGLNGNIHANISCAVDAVIYQPKHSSNVTPISRERIRHWFPYLRSIGGESVEGHVLQTSFSEDTELFIFKTPKKLYGDDLIHETFVGFYALNSLRNILPNYMYIYGYTSCSSLILHENEPVTWCSSDTPKTSYMIAENIRNSVSFADFVLDPNITLDDFLAVMVQILNALDVAYKKYEFTHYDLHSGNILVKTYPEIIAIPCMEGYVASKYVPYLIDYGSSTVTISDLKFGRIGLESYGISNDAFPMYDVYKLLGFLAQGVISSPNREKLLPTIERLFSFFNEGSIRSRVNKRLITAGDYYQAPSYYIGTTYDTYISWVMAYSGIVFPIHRELDGFVKAPIDTPLDVCQFFEMISNERPPRTFLEYCEYITAVENSTNLSQEKKMEMISAMNSKFNAEEYLLDTLAEVNDEIRILFDSQEKAEVPDVNTIDTNNPEEATDYYRKVMTLLWIKDEMVSFISYLKSAICALQHQGLLETYIDDVQVLIDNTNMMRRFLTEQRAMLIENDKIMQYAAVTVDDSVAHFWMKRHPQLVYAM